MSFILFLPRFLWGLGSASSLSALGDLGSLPLPMPNTAPSPAVTLPSAQSVLAHVSEASPCSPPHTYPSRSLPGTGGVFPQAQLEQSKALELQGVTAAEAGDLSTALERFGQAINLLPERASAYNNRAQARRLQGDVAGEGRGPGAHRPEVKWLWGWGLGVGSHSTALEPAFLPIRQRWSLLTSWGYYESQTRLHSICLFNIS